MHKRIHTALLAAASVAVLILPASAQSDALKVQFNQPIRVGQTGLPAGNYTIRLAQLGNDPPILSVESDHGNKILVPAMRCSTPNNDEASANEVVLERQGNELQLTKMWLAGRSYGYSIIH